MNFFKSPELNNHAFTSKLYVLDPLSVIVKLAILSNKPTGTKITIQQNAIEINDYSFFQGMYRLINGYNKSDLHYLHNPIHFACKTYLTSNTQELFLSAQRGIKRLIDTYKQYSLITVCLTYYDSIINVYMESLNNKQNDNKIVASHNDQMTSMYTPELLSSLSNMWTTKNLKIITDLNTFLSHDDLSNSSSNQNVIALENIMNGIDKESRDIILTI